MSTSTSLLSYNCSLDHYLDPVNLNTSPFLHRERTFLGNPRTPRDLLLHSTTRVRVADADADAATGAIGAPDSESAIPAEIVIPAGLSISALRARLGALPAKLLRVDDVLRAFGGFDETTEGRRELTTYHEELQEILSSWCCTADERFKRTAGVIPYVLPPLEGLHASAHHDALPSTGTCFRPWKGRACGELAVGLCGRRRRWLTSLTPPAMRRALKLYGRSHSVGRKASFS